MVALGMFQKQGWWITCTINVLSRSFCSICSGGSYSTNISSIKCASSLTVLCEMRINKLRATWSILTTPVNSSQKAAGKSEQSVFLPNLLWSYIALKNAKKSLFCFFHGNDLFMQLDTLHLGQFYVCLSHNRNIQKLQGTEPLQHKNRIKFSLECTLPDFMIATANASWRSFSTV